MNVWYWVLAAVLALVPTFFIFRKDKKQAVKFNWLPAILRWLAFFLVLALILVPPFVRTHYKEQAAKLIVLIDSSTSMQNALKFENSDYTKILSTINGTIKNDIQLEVKYFSDGIQYDSTAKGNSTDIAKTLQDLQEQMDDATQGVVLISDGIYNQGGNPALVATYSKIPYFAVGVGDTLQPVDIAIEKVYVNRTVSADNIFEVVADIKYSKMNPQALPVSIMLNGQSVAKKDILISKTSGVSSVSFELKAGKRGTYQYSINVAQVKEEKNILNNLQYFTVEVVDEALDILVWQLSPHPDVTAIKKSLELGASNKVILHTGKTYPEQLDKYALIVTHNLPQANLPEDKVFQSKSQWHIIGLQSDVHWLNRTFKGIKGVSGSNLNNVFPSFNKGFILFQPKANIVQILESLPPLAAPFFENNQINTNEILMYQRVGNVATSNPLWFFDFQNGNKAFTIGEGIWRWKIYEFKKNQNQDVVDDLIQQTANLIAVKKDERPLKVYLEKQILTEDETVVIQASLKNNAGKLINDVPVTLQVKDSVGKMWNFDMQPFGNAYRTQVGLLSQGYYEVLAQSKYDQKILTATTAFNVSAVSLEDLNWVSDYSVLQKIAQQSGGQFVVLKHLNSVLEEINNSPNFKTLIKEEQHVVKLIDMKFIFILILLALVSEWIFRKYFMI